MEPAGISQTKKLAEADITSLCFTCKWRSGCAFSGWSEMIGEEQEPGVHRLHIIAECSDYAADRSADDPTYGNLRPQLWQAGIRDLCSGCPSAEGRDCRRHQQLEAMTARSRGGDQWVKAAMICCASTEDRLYQIAEPQAAK